MAIHYPCSIYYLLPAPHLSAPKAPLFLRLRRSPFGASVAFETVPRRNHAPRPARDWLMRSVQTCAQGHCEVQCLWPVRTFSKWAILHHFPNFHTLMVEIYLMFFHSRLHMTPMNRAKFHGNRSTRFSEIRNADTQTDRHGNFIYVYIDVSVSAI